MLRQNREKCIGKGKSLKETTMSSVLNMCEKHVSEDVRLYTGKTLRRKVQLEGKLSELELLPHGSTDSRKLPQGKWVHKEETLSTRVPRPTQ